MSNTTNDFPYVEKNSAEHILLKMIYEICASHTGDCKDCQFRVPKRENAIINDDFYCGIIEHKFIPWSWDLD